MKKKGHNSRYTNSQFLNSQPISEAKTSHFLQKLEFCLACCLFKDRERCLAPRIPLNEQFPGFIFSLTGVNWRLSSVQVVCMKLYLAPSKINSILFCPLFRGRCSSTACHCAVEMQWFTECREWKTGYVIQLTDPMKITQKELQISIQDKTYFIVL